MGAPKIGFGCTLNSAQEEGTSASSVECGPTFQGYLGTHMPMGAMEYRTMLVCLLAQNLPPPDFPFSSRGLPCVHPTKSIEYGPHLPNLIPSTSLRAINHITISAHYLKDQSLAGANI
jgi:hypothetical protein